MQRFVFRTVLALSFGGILAAGAQTATQATSPSSSACGVLSTGLMIYQSAKFSPPFSATIRTTHEQKLADGNSIHGEVFTHEYRDSAGRLRAETSMPCQIGPDGLPHPTLNVLVEDPVNHTHMSWQLNGNGPGVVHLLNQPTPDASAAAPPPPTEEQRRRSDQMRQQWSRNTRHELLGTRTIAGVLTEGSRQITTIPAGEQGNAEPMEISIEVWIAKDTGIAMLRVDDSPTGGRTTTEVTDFAIGEPDPSVFIPPPDYKVEEQNARALVQ